MSVQDENLVLLVEKYPQLYDMSNGNYSNNEVKENIWKEIAGELNSSVTQCKDKWKKLRDNFRKAIKARKTKSGDAAKKIRPWKLENQMGFLLPHITKRTQTSNLEIAGDDSLQASDDSQSDINSPPPTPSTSSTTTSVTDTPASKMKKRETAKSNTVADVLHNYLHGKRTFQKVEEPQNSLRSFFLSMADATQNLPPHLQLEVKSKVFTVVNEAEIAALSYNQRRNTVVPYGNPFSNASSSQNPNNFLYKPPMHDRESPDLPQYHSYTYRTIPAFTKFTTILSESY